MKIIFCALSVAVLVFGSHAQAANYSGTNNKNDTIAPEDGEVHITNTNINGKGVGWSSGTGTTTVTGNIRVDSVSEAIGISTANCHIILQAAKDTDSIILDSSSGTAYGVVRTTSKAVDSTIVLDATQSADQTVYITTSSDYGSMAGIAGDAGTVRVVGNLSVTGRGDGITTTSSNIANTAVVEVTGNTTINTTGSTGLEAWQYSQIKLNGNADITSGEMGIYSFIGCTVEIGGSLSITSKRGMEATNGKIILNGIHGMAIAEKAAAIAVGSNSDGHVGTVIGNAAVYKFTGLLSATRDGLIDMDMREDSDYIGYTKNSAGTINIALSDTAKWTLTQDSTMTNLNVHENSQVVFTIKKRNDFTDITLAVAMLEAGAIVTVNLDGYDPLEGDEFRLLIADTYTIDDDLIYNLGALNEGLYWDTSDFATTGTIRVTARELIPEPATTSMALAALATLTIRRRR